MRRDEKGGEGPRQGMMKEERQRDPRERGERGNWRVGNER